MPHSIKFSIGFVFLASQKSYQPFRVIRLWRKSRFIGFLGYAEFLAFLALAIFCIVKSNSLGLKCSLQFILFASSLNISTISQFVFVLILSSVGVFATPSLLENSSEEQYVFRREEISRILADPLPRGEKLMFRRILSGSIPHAQRHQLNIA